MGGMEELDAIVLELMSYIILALLEMNIIYSA